jgi:hypothetical protein
MKKSPPGSKIERAKTASEPNANEIQANGGCIIAYVGAAHKPPAGKKPAQ